MSARWRAVYDPAWAASVHPDLDAYPLLPDEWRLYAHICSVVGRDRYQRRLEQLADARYVKPAAEAARTCGLSERRVRDVWALLVAAGMLDGLDRPGKTTVYRVRPRADWVPAERLPALRGGRTAARRAGDLGTKRRGPRHTMQGTPARPADHSTYGGIGTSSSVVEEEVAEALGVLRRGVGTNHAHRIDAEREQAVAQLVDVRQAVAGSLEGGDPPRLVDVARALTGRGWDGCRDPVAAVLGRRRRAEAVAVLAGRRSRARAVETDDGCPMGHLHGAVVDDEGRAEPCDQCGATEGALR